MFKNISTFCFFIISSFLCAQDLPSLLQEADEAFGKQDFRKTYRLLSQYRSLKPMKQDEGLQYAIAAYNIGKLDDCLEQLAFIQQTERKPKEEVYFFGGKAKMHKGLLKEAAKDFKMLLAEYKLSEAEQRVLFDYLRNCAYGLKAVGLKSESITQNLGEKINGPYHEFAPIYSPNYEDVLYFSKTTASNLGGRRNAKGLADDNGQFRADIFKSQRVNGLWTEAEPLTSLINSPKEDIILGFANQGKIMFYYSGFTPLCGQIRVDTFTENSTDKPLFPSVFQGPVYAESCETDVLFMNEGNLLFFASNELPGFGGYDLFYRVKQDSSWSEAINLGEQVNTAYDERWPFLSKDGRTLYFSSNLPSQSYGGFDVFKASFDDDKMNFTSSINVGFGINSVGDDTGFKLNTSGNAAIFASDRSNSQGGFDLYTTYFKQPQAEQKIVSSPPLFTQLIPDYVNTIGVYPQDSTELASETNPSSMQDISLQQHIFVNPNLPVYVGSNATVLDNWAAILTNNPDACVALIGHHAAVSPDFYSVDLFSAYDIAAKTQNYLIQKGVPAKQIKVTSAGSRYPYGKKDNPLFLKLSNRVEAYFYLPKHIQLTYQEADEVLRLEDKSVAGAFRNEQKGLTYRVEVLVTDQLWNDALMNQYQTVLLEKDELNKNHYLIGTFDNLAVAKSFQGTLAAKSYINTLIVPYYNGYRLNAPDIYKLLEEYPQLSEFVGD